MIIAIALGGYMHRDGTHDINLKSPKGAAHKPVVCDVCRELGQVHSALVAFGDKGLSSRQKLLRLAENVHRHESVAALLANQRCIGELRTFADELVALAGLGESTDEVLSVEVLMPEVPPDGIPNLVRVVLRSGANALRTTLTRLETATPEDSIVSDLFDVQITGTEAMVADVKRRIQQAVHAVAAEYGVELPPVGSARSTNHNGAKAHSRSTVGAAT